MSPIKRVSKQGKVNNHKYKRRFLQTPAKKSTEQTIKPSTTVSGKTKIVIYGTMVITVVGISGGARVL